MLNAPYIGTVETLSSVVGIQQAWIADLATAAESAAFGPS